MTAAEHQLHAPVPCPECGDTVPAAIVQAVRGGLQLHAAEACSCGAPPPAVELLPAHPAYTQLAGWLAGLAAAEAAGEGEG